jgi:RNA polymerase sigma factor (sigma-70 family)
MTTWLTTIVTNSALSQLRRRPRNPHVSLDERLAGEQGNSVSDRLADVRPSPESEYIRSETYGNLMQLVRELSPPMREAVQLCYFDGLTMREAAQVLDVPEGTFKARLWRARWQLRRLTAIRGRGLHR